MVHNAAMSQATTKCPITEERGTPRELAERMTRLPEGQYRVFVQWVQSHEEVLADFDRDTERLRRSPMPETADMTDDEVLAWGDDIVQEVRRSRKTNSRHRSASR